LNNAVFQLMYDGNHTMAYSIPVEELLLVINRSP